MPTSSTYDKLCTHVRETAVLASAQGLLEWDERTKMPVLAGPYRAEQVAFLSGLIHQRQTAPELGEWLAELADSPLATEPHSETETVIRELRRTYDKKTKLPQSLVEELTRASILGQQAWVETRPKNDFASFRPLLERMIELKRQEAAAIGYEDTPYDALLDDYEPGETTANITRVLAALRERLVPLVARIAESGKRAPVEILHRNYPVAKQEEFGKRVAATLGFNFDAGRLDITQHPFCGGTGPLDVRLTTHYDERFFNSGFYSILHEAGHGIYEQGLPKEHYGLPTGSAISLGIHESQSRSFENLVGRSRAFWGHFYAPLQQAFPEALKDVPLADFYFAINDSRPSLIRIEADEATYNLHILVRFELEQSLIAGDLRVADLPAAWTEKYRHYLGIAPPDDADGCMQDVHWAAGLFGYFPTYSLGNLYAAQFFEQAQHDLGDLPAQFRRGDFKPLHDWHRQHIYNHGQCWRAEELVQKITGKPLSHEPLMAHLETKFGELYGF
ncbi:MAG: carboxypeptidase M32 [Pirellulales bacterium]